MSKVMITCPEAQRPVDTGVRLSSPLFSKDVKLGVRTLRCPHCGERHEWSEEDLEFESKGS